MRQLSLFYFLCVLLFPPLNGMLLSSFTLYTDVCLNGDAFYSGSLRKIECMAECARNTQCNAGSYEPATRTCKLLHYGSFEIQFSATKTEQLVFMKKIPIMLVVHSDGHLKFTLHKAKEACAYLGGRLVSDTEVVTEYLNGYQKCVCGWVGNEYPYYINHILSPRCGFVGINSCWNWYNGYYDAYCTRP